MKAILGVCISALVFTSFVGCGASEEDDASGVETADIDQAASVSWPSPSSTIQLSSTKTVSGTFDGGNKRYQGWGGGQSEGQDPLFVLNDGATIQNVVIGNKAGDGIHCKGACTIKNVWWEDVGEDAATLEGSGSMTVVGGGARYASDKIFQHNGSGTMNISGFYAESMGKLYRSCGNCKNGYQGKRTVNISNTIVTKVNSVVVGINSNYGDQANISGLTVLNDSSKKTRICAYYKGNNSGQEPERLGYGPGYGCNYSSSNISWK